MFAYDYPDWMVGLFLVALTILAGTVSFFLARRLALGNLSEGKGELAFSFAGFVAAVNCLFLVFFTV